MSDHQSSSLFNLRETKMLTCIARSKQAQSESPSAAPELPGKSNPNDAPTKHSIKALSSQIKDIALKASGAYRHCAPCANHSAASQTRRSGSLGGEMEPDRFRWSYRRTGSSSSISSSTAGRRELEARLKVISSGEATPASASGRRPDPVVFVEESEPKEWVAQVEPGVLITFVSLPPGGNDLKRIRFSREMFNKWQAQQWWADNCEKVMELYNVQRLNRQAFPLPSPPNTEEENGSKFESIHNSPVTPPLGRERGPPRRLHQPDRMGIPCSSPDSLDQLSIHSRSNYDSYGAGSTTKLSSISAAKTEAALSSVTTGSSRNVDYSREVSISNASYLETEWVEEDEPGVYITIRALPDGRRELKRVRFSREKYGEMHARVWWEENRARIHKQYL